jgi:CheY-like chemotaxis protein
MISSVGAYEEPTETMARILLVEDNEMNRDMLSRRLERRGHVVSIAVDGEQGVSQARAEKPDLILMDMSLPLMDGWESTRVLKADPETRRIPIIGLTAHAMAGDRERCLEAGCEDYDTKPVELTRLLEKMDAALARAVGEAAAPGSGGVRDPGQPSGCEDLRE